MAKVEDIYKMKMNGKDEVIISGRFV